MSGSAPEYGDYARRAATAIEDAANSIAAKDADELIDDTREFVRKSPGVALGRRGDRRLRAGPAGQVRSRQGSTMAMAASARATSARPDAQARRSDAA